MIRRLARLLGLIPTVSRQSFDGVVNGVSYSAKPLSGDATAVSIHLTRYRLQDPPAIFVNSVKNEDSLGRSGRVGELVHCIFRLGASSVDVGTASDAIIAVFPNLARVVDAPHAEQAVALMTQLRAEMTGEQLAMPPRTMPDHPPTVASVEIDGRMIRFEFSPCLIDADEDDGTFGNLDVTVRTDPQMTSDALWQHLRLAIPGYDEILDAPGCGSVDQGIELGFALIELAAILGHAADDKRQAWLRNMVATLKKVDVVWAADQTIPLATIPCLRRTAL